MFEVMRSKKSVAFTILDGAMSTATLLFSLYLTSEVLKGHLPFGILLSLYIVFIAARISQAGLRKDKGKIGIPRLLISAGIYAVTAVLIVVFRKSRVMMLIAVIGYLVDLLVGRIFGVVRTKRWSVRIINILLSLFILDLLIGMNDVDLKTTLILFYAVMGLICFQSLVHIISISFSQIKLNILMRIIRKTYALEILFGLLMLIAAFSYVLVFTDGESIHTYGDGLWYCFAIVTTIGFGDMVATSVIGRILSVILGIYGIIVVALVTSIIINFYSEIKDVPEEGNPGPDKDPEEAPSEETEVPEQKTGPDEKNETGGVNKKRRGKREGKRR